MAKKATAAKKATKKTSKVVTSNRFPLIEQALLKHTKAELVAMMVSFAKTHSVIARELENQLAIEKPIDVLMSDVSSAIDRATAFDERMMNYNFDYDQQAYNDVARGLARLVELGQLETAKLLALKLLKAGSYQVECSDEGLMCDDIEECLTPVILAVRDAGDDEAKTWAGQMLAADCIEAICRDELADLRAGR